MVYKEYKTLTDVYLQALTKISDSLVNISDSWALVGSMNHYIQGVNLEPKDIDIITTRAGLLNISHALQIYNTKKVNYYENEKIRSFYGEFLISSMKVELFSEVENKINGGWHKHPEWQSRVEIHDYIDIKLPILPLEYELRVYKKLGMEKRANKLLNKMTKS